MLNHRIKSELYAYLHLLKSTNYSVKKGLVEFNKYGIIYDKFYLQIPTLTLIAKHRMIKNPTNLQYIGLSNRITLHFS